MEKASAFPQKKQDLRHCGLDPQSHSLRHSEDVSPTESSLFNKPKAGLLRCNTPRNDVMANEPLTLTLSRKGRGNSSPVKNLLPYYPSALMPWKKSAFTLAEVLITLGIIGVVAAMTLPALIGNYQKQVTVNKLKRSYTTISQMFTRARSDYGDPNEWSFSYGAVYNSDGTSNFSVVLPEVAKTYFLPYLDVIDDCGTACKKVPSYKYLNNNLINEFHTHLYYTIFLKDGSIIFFTLDNDGTNLFDLIIYVDINGLKGPNILGVDVFSYYLNTSGAAKTNFWGLTGTNVSRENLLNYTRGCNRDGLGQYCGALIQYDGWEIKDDYPYKF